uniref:Uncharacterized protein n=1 Tax=Heterorhabditis bacteriophora TaxID=37862 RepID=A0A1I7WTC9_HETBA
MALAILDNVSTSTWDPVDTEKGSSRGEHFIGLLDFSLILCGINSCSVIFERTDSNIGNVSIAGAVSELTASTSVPIPSCSSGFSTPSTATPTVECNVHKSWVQKSENGH